MSGEVSGPPLMSPALVAHDKVMGLALAWRNSWWTAQSMALGIKEGDMVAAARAADDAHNALSRAVMALANGAHP